VRETFESYLFDYNTRPTGVTGFSPLEIMMNCTICAKFAVLDRKSKHTDETIRDRVRDQIAKEKEKKNYADDARNAKPDEFKHPNSLKHFDFNEKKKSIII
jgi:hypothetical protein